MLKRRAIVVTGCQGCNGLRAPGDRLLWDTKVNAIVGCRACLPVAYATARSFKPPKREVPKEVTYIDVTDHPHLTLPRTLLRYDLIASIDCEYFKPSGKNVPNTLLSFQFSVVDVRTRRYIEWIHHFQAGDPRPTLVDLMGDVLMQCGVLNAKGVNGWPRVLLLWHHGDAELSHLADRERWMSAPNKLITPGGGLLSARPLELAVSEFGDPSPDADFRAVTTDVRDTQALAPEGFKSLEAVASTNTAWKKVTISRRDIKAMEAFRRRDPQGFEVYALGDTRATLEAYVSFARRAFVAGATKGPPMTASSTSASVFIASMDKGRFRQVFGLEKDEDGIERPLTQLAEHDQFASACYWGGFNSFTRLGRVERPESYSVDLDFSSAYPTALAALERVDWDTLKEVKCHPRHANRFDWTRGYSWVWCSFKFPNDVKYPNLAVQVDGALVFPMAGETYCTGIEVRRALELGAQLTIHKVVRADVIADDAPFAEHLKTMIDERNAAKRAGDALGDKLYKLFCNGLYGKVCQALKLKRVAGGRLERSRVSNPFYGAQVTALVRTELNVTIDACERLGLEPMHATTDGLCLFVPKDWASNALETNTKGAPISVFPKLDEALGPEAHWIFELANVGRTRLGHAGVLHELKLHSGHDAPGVIQVYRTRAYAILSGTDVLAVKKGGLKIQTYGPSDERLKRQLNRLKRIKRKGRALHKSIELIQHGELVRGSKLGGVVKDVQLVLRKRMVDLETDWKRIRLVPGQPETRPVVNVAEYQHFRARAKALREQGLAPRERKVLTTTPATKRVSRRRMKRLVSMCLVHGLYSVEEAFATAALVKLGYYDQRADFASSALPSGAVAKTRETVDLLHSVESSAGLGHPQKVRDVLFGEGVGPVEALVEWLRTRFPEPIEVPCQQVARRIVNREFPEIVENDTLRGALARVSEMRRK